MIYASRATRAGARGCGSAPTLVNITNQMHQCAAPFCRDKGWMLGGAGALCLSSWQRDSSGFRDAKESHADQDKHKAPASIPPRPLSLQNRSECFRSLLHSVVKHRQGIGTPRRSVVGAGLAPALEFQSLAPVLVPFAPALVNTVMTYVLLCMLALLLTSCNWPGAQQTAQSDGRLKLFHVLSARIIMLDTQAEVDGSLQNTSHTDRFPYDVTVIATFYNRAGNVVGQAGGVAEDVYPGMSRPFTLVGQVDSTQYSHMVVTVISLKERRIEKTIPTPSVVP